MAYGSFVALPYWHFLCLSFQMRTPLFLHFFYLNGKFSDFLIIFARILLNFPITSNSKNYAKTIIFHDARGQYHDGFSTE